MKCFLRLGVANWLFLGTLLFAQNPPSADQKPDSPAKNSSSGKPSQATPGEQHRPIEVLSDTGGVDFRSYIRRVLPMLQAHWYRRVPDSARPPAEKKGELAIDFSVMKDGTISNLRYSKRSGDSALDQAAYDGITDSSPLPRLPDAFACQYVALRIHFFYNQNPHNLLNESDLTNALIPCVTTAIRTEGEIGISVSPSSAQVVTGGRQQFLAAVTGATNSPLSWSVKGSGCTASACGAISIDGLYTAPPSIPNPPTITITAALANAPSETASATVVIVASNPSR